MKLVMALMLACLLNGCSSMGGKSLSSLEVSDNPHVLAESSGGIDYLGVPLKSGQIIVSDSNTALNFTVTLTDTEYHPYTHAGIISVERGKPYVYHAIAQLRLLFNGSPTDLTKGAITRTSLNTFINDKAVVAIYNPQSEAIGRSISEFAIRSHAEKLRYDALFDAVDRSKVYCSEFIVSAIEDAGGNPIQLRARNKHRSIDTIYNWLSIEANAHYFVKDLVSQDNRVALLSASLRSDQISRYFALREELYRRFTPDQKLGNIMRWTGFGPAFRPQISLFIQRGIDESFRARHRGETLPEWVMALADEVLGTANLVVD